MTFSDLLLQIPKGRPGTKPVDPEIRFWKKVMPEPNSGCWLWEGGLDGKGYGTFLISLPVRHNVRAHRFSYELHKGAIPAELELDHLCRNKVCVNPDHLEPVTHEENMRRCPELGKWSRAHITHCPHGHEYSDENTYMWRNMRHCRECNRITNRERARELARKKV